MRIARSFLFRLATQIHISGRPSQQLGGYCRMVPDRHRPGPAGDELDPRSKRLRRLGVGAASAEEAQTRPSRRWGTGRAVPYHGLDVAIRSRFEAQELLDLLMKAVG
jgi:hypothetical protein